MLPRRLIFYCHANEQLKLFLQTCAFHESGKIKTGGHAYSSIVGKYNKSEKKKFVISSCKHLTEFKNGHHGKHKVEKVANRTGPQSSNNVYLNKITHKQNEKKKKCDRNEMTEIVQVSKINNSYIRYILPQKGLQYLYTYQYALIELLNRSNNVIISLLYSDCMVSYVVYSFYKINAANVDAQEGVATSKREEDNTILIGDQTKKGRKKYNFVCPDKSVLMVASSQAQTSALYEMIIKLKPPHVSTYLINNEENIQTVRSNYFLYNIIILNAENFLPQYDFSVLLDLVNFIIIDDLSELYHLKMDCTVKNILTFCKEKQDRGDALQLLLVNKSHDQWVVNDLLQHAHSVKYELLAEGDGCQVHGVDALRTFNQRTSGRALPDNERGKYPSGKKTHSRGKTTTNVTPRLGEIFHYVNLRKYRKNNCDHFSICAPMSEDKKFLILFYLLKKNKGKRIIIYYNKCDVYAFYGFVNAYIPCMFVSSSHKVDYKNSIVRSFNKTREYVLITDDMSIKKAYPVDANVHIHYTFQQDANLYVDALFEGVPGATHGDAGSDVAGSLVDRSGHSANITPLAGTQSILFYSKKQRMLYEEINAIFNFKSYPLPSAKELKDNFLTFLIDEIKEVLIEDNKHVEEAEKIHEKYGHAFLSAALYYIQKKKLFKKNFKKKEFSNVTFIVERNAQLNTKGKVIIFLNELLNLKKSVGDINFFVQNYVYCKRGYIMTVSEDIYNVMHKNKSTGANAGRWADMHMYILYNNFENRLRATHRRRGVYQSKKSLRRLKKRMNMKMERVEMKKLKSWMSSTFKLNRRNVKKDASLGVTEGQAT
ncbi:conserved Plasmodium protein, unknown function [Plasmodium knowlesi strain H]|uniref:Uncharacterized protein n=3 Tax=Plasmodium knowlesi TaxID=5850 RepID=A0A5K1VAJ4_PLAKH|nr:conserved Plasmodium protein, unknown function [Plasmodium knowlesi strain H]OTN65219.1 Uncharacterized protein PKNOH_S120128400 [Plasmodium knowlesi]CAA9988147.1 conserved Plasmodium protein, unknown function [Plasmodium knowlesi strain H]SBO20044.1 conserved Plasmodium protein, unknown function [Plasmodium knowlesi strain H]SBO20783.1 conserved Plasmodium protein, unknown function [Plasmodium knowlesi strain H]VVS77621.1 conserved Plasmodium protein, unknown function [Plasmodium knowlesi |eukprot:XP_002259123.1 hypothetical protein, conserved in Plasmodium species [Plasmodium knowlesi strain H]